MTKRTCQMVGCMGDEKKAGPYTTGECPTIELALKELQIHIETYHERDRKKKLKCTMDDCRFETEYLPDDAAIEHLRIHVNSRHQPKLETPEGRNGNLGANENKTTFKAVMQCSVQKESIL